MAGRKDMLKLSDQQKEEFVAKLESLCKEFGVTINSDTYCDESYISLTDKDGNWSILQNIGNGMKILEEDYWEY